MPVEAMGLSGKKYVFERYDNISAINSINAYNCVYIYAKEVNNAISPVYIGITTRSFNDRYLEHNNDGINECANRNGANLILIHSRGTILGGYTEDELKNIEKDLLDNFNTPCNTQNN